ncbi:MAG: DUF1501 domain-containing protein [Nannocystis sp.]|nr:DUF1501 domain-containing protein [Nannocystis sp.]MBA3550489.1 DUF1501 domain-containing protein [Nannocystis sp.]
MDRRKFLSLASLAGLAVASTDAFGRPGTPNTLGKNPTPLYEAYKGPLYIMVNAGGGWDPTSLCDPKGSASAEDPDAMNRSYRTSDIGVTPSGIRYAPLGTMDNPNYFRDFFEKHDKELLVINGVDMATNGHETGQVHTWSGRLASGYPSFAALAAAVYGRDLPMSYLSFGGYDDTQGQVARTRSGNTQALARIAYPDRIDPNNEESLFHSPAASKAILDAQLARKDRLLAHEQLPRVQRAIGMMYASRTGSNELKRLQQFLPEMLDNSGNGLLRQIQVAMAAYKAGITVAVNLDIGGFDTHGNHDQNQIPQLQKVIEGLDFITKEAERQGVAGNYVVMAGSDFGRTPGYNDTNGKDHWAISSVIAMGKGIRGGRVIGETTERHDLKSIDPKTLKVSESGIHIEPKHIHMNLRRLAGIEADELMNFYPLSVTAEEEMNLFS